jgi:serine protease
VSRGLPRRAQAGVALGIALTFLIMASSPALADHVRSQEWWLRTLHVTRAWRSTHGAGVIVALLDTGVDVKQADLTGSVLTGPDYTHSKRTPGGAFWGIHGTAMASIIAGHGHGAGNADGVVGIAPSARILSVRVTLESNDPLLGDATVAAGLPAAIAHGIRYAVKQHAAVIDLPLDPVTTRGAAGSGGSPAERAAVAYALARHVVLVAPAGDGAGSDAMNYPAAYPGVISVGAFNEKFIKAPYSSRRPYVTLTAAGDGVTAANGLKGYAPVRSTSAASAAVAGIVALIKAQFPALSPAQVRQVLTSSTVFRPPGGRNDGSGHGTVDAAAALMAASKLVEAVPATATGASAGAQAPPSAPAVHGTVVQKNLRHNLMTDAGIAVVVFLVLLGSIFGVTTWRRRRARSARLAEVRAATRVPARKTRKPAGKRKPSSSRKPGTASARRPAIAGTAAGNGAAANATVTTPAWPPGSNPAPGAGLPAAGMSGSWVSGGALAGAADGRVAGPSGRPAPQIEPVGFLPAPLSPGANQPGFTGAGSGSAAGAGPAASGGEAADPAAGSPAPVNAPPWAPVPDPNARPRGAGGAAIPDSAFPGAVAEPPGEPSAGAGSGSAGRAGGRRAQGSHRASQVRTPAVSGNPPWEPAPQPDTELPWTQAPAPPPVGTSLPQRQPVRPEMPAWEAIAEEAWPGGPQVANPHPPARSALDPEPERAGSPAGPAGPARMVPHPPAGQDDGRPEAAQPIYAWNPDSAAERRPAAEPEPRSGFLRGARPPAAEQPPPDAGPAPSSPGPAGPASASAGPAGSASAGTGSFGPRSSGSGPAGPEPASGAPAGNPPKTGVPPWEITDSFLAIRTESPGAARGDGASPGEQSAAPWEGSPDPRRPAEPGGSFPAAPPAPSGGAGFPRGGGSFPSTSAQPRSFGGGSDLFSRSEASSSGAPGENTGLPRGSSFPGAPSETSSFPRGGSSFPPPPADTPSFPRGGNFPASPGLPRDATPGDGSGDGSAESTESFPTVTSSSGGALPRRIPLSERTGGFPPNPQRSDDEAFRLFPFGRDSGTPTENTED